MISLLGSGLKKLNRPLVHLLYTTKMTTIWIHRAYASDILVRFENTTEAYQFAMKAIANANKAYYMDTGFNGIPAVIDEDGVGIVHASNIQIMALPIDGRPKPIWNPIGFVCVTPEEALELYTNYEPEGFIPYESDSVWTKNTRTKEELDAELDNYMNEWVNLMTPAIC